MRALITGGLGFVGRHLASHLVSCGDDVAVAHLPSERSQVEVGIPLPKTAQTLSLDVTDSKAVQEVIALLRPDVIYHLAGVAFVPQAEAEEMEKVYRVNMFGALNVLEALKQHALKTRFLFVSSAAVYGEPWPGALPFTELSVLRPVNTYAVSKAAGDLATFKYATHDGLDTVRVRPFPHIGPGQSDKFALSSFAKQLAQIKLGKIPPIIRVGNLESKRDYTDVSDIVRGYREAMLNGKRGESYNLCSGKSTSISELLNRLVEIAEVEVEIQIDPERQRAVDVTDMYGSFDKAHRDFGWKPRIELDGTLTSIFAYWVERLESD